MKTTGKSLAFAGIGAIACMMFSSSPAHAQAFSFGYSGPGVSVGVKTGNYGYFRRYRLLHRRISHSGARCIRGRSGRACLRPPARSPGRTARRPSPLRRRQALRKVSPLSRLLPSRLVVSDAA